MRLIKLSEYNYVASDEFSHIILDYDLQIIRIKLKSNTIEIVIKESNTESIFGIFNRIIKEVNTDNSTNYIDTIAT